MSSHRFAAMIDPMDADQYKAQFMRFLQTCFPDGLPDLLDYIKITIGPIEYALQFDRQDYEAFLNQPTNPKEFESLLDDNDIKLLQSMRIYAQVKSNPAE